MVDTPYIGVLIVVRCDANKVYKLFVFIPSLIYYFYIYVCYFEFCEYMRVFINFNKLFSFIICKLIHLHNLFIYWHPNIISKI